MRPDLVALLVILTLGLSGILTAQETFSVSADENDLQDVYCLSERLIRERLFTGSPFIGQTIRQSGLREKYKLNLVALQRKGRMNESIAPDLEFKSGDILHLIGRLDLIPIPELEKLLGLFFPPINHLPTLVEVVLTPRSPLLG